MVSLALALLSVPAHARDLSLADAVALARSGPLADRAGYAHDEAAAGVDQAQGAWDPTLTASGSDAYTESQGFLAGFPTSSRGTTASGSVGLQQALPTGTTVALSTALDRDDTTSSSTFSSGADQTQRSWTGSAGLTVTQDLLAPVRASASTIAVRTARQQLDQADVTLALERTAAIQQVATAWWSWWQAVDAAGVAERSLERARSLEDRTRVWRDAGQIAQLELDRVTADRLGAERDQLQADAAVHRRADALLVLLGQPVGQDLAPVGSGSAWPAGDLADVDRIVADALDRSLTLASDRAALALASSSLGDARDLRWPTLTLSGSAGVGSLSETAQDAVTALVGSDGFPRASVALDFAVPLGGRNARGSADRSAAAVEIARSQLAQDTAQVEADTRAAVADALTAQRSLALARARLDVARSTEQGESARVDEGVRRLDQLLDAIASREAAEVDVRAAEVAVAQAELALAALRDRVEGGDAG